MTSDSSVQTAMAWALPQNCFGLWVQRCLECGCACPSMACIRQHAWNCMVSFDIFLGHHASANKNAREARHIHPMHGGSVHAEWSRAEPRLQVFAQHQALELSVMKISDLKVCIFSSADHSKSVFSPSIAIVRSCPGDGISCYCHYVPSARRTRRASLTCSHFHCQAVRRFLWATAAVPNKPGMPAGACRHRHSQAPLDLVRSVPGPISVALC